MRTNVRRVVAVLAALGLAAPALAAERDAAGSRTQGTGAGAAEGGAAKALDRKLVEGLEQLHAANQAEIQGGKLAQQAASSDEVRSFGEKMVGDHSRNDEQLTSMAQAMGVSLRGEAYERGQKDAEQRMGKVQAETGAAFDKAYAAAMVKDHEKDARDVKKLGDRARKGGHAELATFLAETEAAMQGHLAMARQLEKAVKDEKGTASRKQGAATTGAGSTASPQ